ncbi:MAG: DUF4235 domain-containing protein [Thermoleophilaceae bacterium]|nr:DUF4235 domain-containing protein [Thermoleophilaceae bacterium]
MGKLLFIPVSVITALITGQIAKKVFDQIWGLIDDEEPPEAKHKEVEWPKVIAAAALQGAIFKAARVATDHGSRRAYYNLIGSWPGEERPEPE